MDQIAARQAIAYPDTHKGWRVWLTPLFSQVIGRTRMPLLILLGAVGVLLLIACANITSLLLGKGAGRRREIAVRAAIGAGRARIIRQLLTESILLGLLGGSFGLLLTDWRTIRTGSRIPGIEAEPHRSTQELRANTLRRNTQSCSQPMQPAVAGLVVGLLRPSSSYECSPVNCTK